MLKREDRSSAFFYGTNQTVATMSSKWAETGILRKKQTKGNFDDLLVFGYSCKLFRDDERAQYIDQGKHLIPWMGDDTLKIDRYDGRGALSDLSSCEASREGYDATRWLGLSENERKVEQLCDEERYYSLLNNEEEDLMYKEEESKRCQTNEFKYDYDVPIETAAVEKCEAVATCEEEDKIYIPAKGLNVPAHIVIPKTVKENARIEKTALFVSIQGPQMEILIKAKQNDNPHFSFLNHIDPLHKYYRHLLNAIKSGQYKTDEDRSQEENEDENASDPYTSYNNESEHYLHPSLLMSANVSAPKTIVPLLPTPAFPYKPTADCAYTQLVSRIKGSAVEKLPSGVERCLAANKDAKPQEHEVSEQYYQYYQAQYYQHYQQIAHQYAMQGNCDITIILQNPQLQQQIQQQAIHCAQAACAHFVPTQPSIPPQIAKTNSEPVIRTPECLESNKPGHKVSLVVYSSDSDECDEEHSQEVQIDEKSTFIIPPKDVALIVDKMATYVAKNGLSFEQGVKEKGDMRFDFLHDSHKYHKYYRYKVNELNSKSKSKTDSLLMGNKSVGPSQGDSNKRKSAKLRSDKLKEKKIMNAVCFSIKKSKDEPAKDIKSALPAEESDEETMLASRGSSPILVPPPTLLTAAVELTCIPKSGSVANMSTESTTSVNGKGSSHGPIFEMIDLTQEPPVEMNDSKRSVEERVKDKFASAAREKALQLERKKRAALFLKMHSERKSENSRIPKGEDTASAPSESELEEGEIKQKSKQESHRSKSSHKRSKSSRSRSSRSYSKSRHRRLKKRKHSPQQYSSSSSVSD